jgi:hypothetical protein
VLLTLPASTLRIATERPFGGGGVPSAAHSFTNQDLRRMRHCHVWDAVDSPEAAAGALHAAPLLRTIDQSSPGL